MPFATDEELWTQLLKVYKHSFGKMWEDSFGIPPSWFSTFKCRDGVTRTVIRTRCRDDHISLQHCTHISSSGLTFNCARCHKFAYITSSLDDDGPISEFLLNGGVKEEKP